VQPTRKAVGCDQSFTILQESFGPSETSLQRTASMFLAIILFIHISYSQLVYILFDVLPLEHKCSHLWAARYNTWLLIKLTPKGVVFSFLFFSFLFFSFLFLSFPFLSFPFLSFLFFSFLFFSFLFFSFLQPPHTNCAGHTSWSTSGLAYLSLWLAGKLRCFDGHGHPWKAIVSVMPTGLAVWIGITRLQVSWRAFAYPLPLPSCSW